MLDYSELDFSLHAGDAITLDVPLIEVDKTSKDISFGLYIITDLTRTFLVMGY